MAMGRNPAVDLKIMPVKVAAPTELYSSSSPPRNLPMSVSRLQYISAVDQSNGHVFIQKNKAKLLILDFSLSLPKTPKLFPNEGPLLVQPFKTLGEAIKIRNQTNFQSLNTFIHTNSLSLIEP